MRVWNRNIDFGVVLAWFGLVLVGLTAIYSTTHGPASEFLLETVQDNFNRQLMWLGVSIVAGACILLFPVRFYQYGAYPAYGLLVLLLLAALFGGTEINGSRAWLRLGPIQLQVSEFAKVGTVLAVAQLLSSRRRNANSVRYALLSVILILVPAAIIVVQNDMGTALIFVGLIPIMLFWSGLPASTLLLMLAPAVAGYLAIVYMPAAIVFSLLFTVGILWFTRERYLAFLAFVFSGGTVIALTFAMTSLLQPYQVKRLLSFTNPEAAEYRDNVGFHLVQSKAAIGSGGLTGKGFMQGTQTQGAYVPEQSTDFVFSVIGEEFGLLGGIIVLLLFAFLLVRLIVLGVQIKHPFGVMVAAGAVGIYLVHVFINMGMATGILPVIGIPLPFMSYGGSALLANTMMLAIVLNLSIRRDEFSIYGY
ncbi:MAG: rod shape-determining protein RodA [Rhodothermales bacterium]|nr:rod shape-determining protein RodA [Rhodothermales bacterium]